jgi:CheY-like chemotaxis protein
LVFFKPRILIVDDEFAIRDAFQQWFTYRGYDADYASDGIEAVEMCAANTYTIITMDLEMPRMNGMEAIHRIKKIRPEIPIIVLTGHFSGSDAAALSKAARILIKPLSLPELEEHIQQVVPGLCPSARN